MTHHIIKLPFFVYGTLLPGEANFDLWREAIIAYRPAVMTGGRLYDLGDFPMLVDGCDGEARGLLVELDPLVYDVMLWRLDLLEGAVATSPGALFYRRVRRVVRPFGAPAAVAWVYIGGMDAVAGLDPIRGDWKSYTRWLVKSI